ncbi:MAG: hypothetical protein K6G65_09870, partial [Lachnospiraceae bacterium]|nr:hypothetical protein [Lachnospiraceae bacterium]
IPIELGIIALMLTWCITYYYQMGLYDKTKDSIVSTWRVLKERVRIKKYKEHTKNARPSTSDKHTKRRPGGKEKKKEKPGWKSRK